MKPAVAAVGRGVGVALAVAVPAALLAQLLDALDDGDPGWITYPLSAVVLGGMALGGWVTARTTQTRPVLLAAMAGLLAIATIQILGAIRRRAAGNDVAWHTMPAVTVVAVGAAALTAALTTGRPGRTRP